MKSLLTACVVLAFALGGPARAQEPHVYKTHIISMRGNDPESMLSGDRWTSVSDHERVVEPFEMQLFRNGKADQVQLIARAPECHIDQSAHLAWDAGHLEMFTPATNVWAQGALTPMTNLWLQGEGFCFLETNRLLYVSNNVETRVRRALLKTTMLSGENTNIEGEGRLLKIFSKRGRFDYQSSFVQYFGNVHVIDAQLDLTSDKLSIQFTTNGAVETVLAEGHVVMTTTNKGRTTSATAFYYVTNGSGMTELTGNAEWRYGDQRAKADKFIYDSTNHFLTGAGRVRVWWPNAPQTAEQKRLGMPPAAGAGGYRELSADFATLQMPPTNGPVEKMHAAGNVIIVNDADQSRGTGERADYARRDGLFELDGAPVWSIARTNQQMEIRGRTLTEEIAQSLYRARGDARLKLKVQDSARPNQWLHIACADIDYQSNRAVFHRNVDARLLDAGALRDRLASDLLEVELFSNEVKTAVATGHVYGETAPDNAGRIKTIACEVLTAHRSPVTRLLQEVIASQNALVQQYGTNWAEPRNRLTAAMVTARFSPVTNQLQEAVAERNVVIDQVKTNQAIHVTSDRAVYTASADEVKLTGAPVARTERYLITDSVYMIWQPKTNRFRAFGPYNVSPVKEKAGPPSF
jgi:lipopolysaccharide export system protein LptA